ncbi:hypothetical protein EIP86_009369 [Pleurotus ostreatoroseus]|nr:hypothetical protein EIP86_009369 [Pleurotus ostreatoroseus]
MRLPATPTTPRNTATNRPASTSSRTLLLAALALLLAAALQFATAWVQHRGRGRCEREGGSGYGAGVGYYEYDGWREAARAASGSGSGSGSGDGGERNWEDDYSWEGDDYPPTLPLPLGPPVALTIEDSRHFALGAGDAAADLEWHALYPGNDLGFLRLGPRKRFFSLTMYHQMHCLASLREGLVRAQSNGGGGQESGHGHGHAKRDAAHASHCLNYLRQTILCAADLTLEPEIAPRSGNVGEGLAVAHVCRDWGAVHKFTERNWEEWVAWQAQQKEADKRRANGTVRSGL